MKGRVFKPPPSTFNPPRHHRLSSTADIPAEAYSAPQRRFPTTVPNSSSSNSSQSTCASVSRLLFHPFRLGRAARAGSQPLLRLQRFPLDRRSKRGSRLRTLGRPFRISLSTVLRREGGERSSTRGLVTPAEVPSPVPPSPTPLVAPTTRAQAPTHTRTVIDTRPSTALPDLEADDNEERKRERRQSWLTEVRGWEKLVPGDLAEDAEGQEAEGQEVTFSSPVARVMAGMGELKSPSFFAVSTSTTATKPSLSGSTRKNAFDEERVGGETFGKAAFDGPRGNWGSLPLRTR
ncbi:hypothetical protein M407DRAFT_31735 [Tulasnella calospora MUT 4182]|uniref:Uncharacterized protein n=1 Tax=Tulasnella calospora MUT 4182 TaxID=1051891 RepID=A0A0C3PUS3_9AGAM|nr:hypothetical protein M407DRAFT_31735 [Tulasnella calospora MUT 4182]